MGVTYIIESMRVDYLEISDEIDAYFARNSSNKNADGNSKYDE
jgi:hypothetical protein